MKVAALDEVFEIARGASPRPIDEHITDDSSGVPWIMIGDASATSKYITGTKKRILSGSESLSRTVEPGDFLLTNSMSFGHPYISKIRGCIHDGWLLLRPRSADIDPEYFYHVLGSDSVKKQFARLASGTTVKNLNSELVRGVRVAIPPLPEQRRIADTLDRADALKRKRQQALKLADDFLRATFLDMFGDPETNPKGLPTAKLGDLCFIGTGGTPSRLRSENYGGAIPWVKTTEVDGSRILQTEETLTDEGLSSSNCKVFPVDSILVAMYGQGKTRGQVGILGIPASTNQACAVITPSSKIATHYLYQHLRLNYERLRRLGRGGNQPNLNLSLVRDHEVLVPSSEEQIRFTSLVARITANVRHLEDSLSHIGRLLPTLTNNLLAPREART